MKYLTLFRYSGMGLNLEHGSLDFTSSFYVSEFYISKIISVLWERSPAVNSVTEALTFLCIYCVDRGSPIPTQYIQILRTKTYI